MTLRSLLVPLAGIVWRAVAVGWWASRAWYVVRASVLTATDAKQVSAIKLARSR